MDAAVSSEPAALSKLAATCTPHRPSEADTARERKLLQLRVIYLCDRFKISQDRIWNLDETAVRVVPAGERGWTKKKKAANMRGGMWTQIVYDGKSDRVPLPARVPLPDALDHARGTLEHDRRDRRGHARARWLRRPHTLAPAPRLCATARCCGISQHHARLPATHQIVLRPAELHGIHSAAGPGVHARLQELDPPRGGQTLRRVLLGSRVQLRTCQSGLQYRSAPTAAAGIRAHSRTERRQPATSNRWLALHRLERGGAA